MYSSYSICVACGCECNHRHGVVGAENVSLVEAYRMAIRGPGYEVHIVSPFSGDRAR